MLIIKEARVFSKQWWNLNDATNEHGVKSTLIIDEKVIKIPENADL
jgi:hypothetical protein